jgi:nitrogen-specific signal transduction histidine kinase/DNA-binding NarL/FixJ family response regulator
VPTDIQELEQNDQENGGGRLSHLELLAAGAAHDFNNFMGNILDYADLALEDEPPLSKPAEVLTKIRTIALRASDIARQMITYIAHEDSGAEPLDISALAEEMLDLMKISISRRAKLTLALERDLPPVLAAPAEIRELLMNLILNASEALNGDQGEIRISTSCVNAAAAASANEGKHAVRSPRVQLVVADTGRGISRKDRAQVFHPFFTMKRNGRGLGLAIVNRIVHKYGGSIKLMSAPGRGTAFKVLLPCANQAAAKEPARKPEPVPVTPTLHSGGKTILVADDDQGLRLAASQLLRRCGFQVVEAADGAAALEALRSHPGAVDAILVDLTLAGVPIRKIIDDAARLRPEADVFITSGYDKGAAEAAFTSPRVKGFLQKPFHTRELIGLFSQPADDGGKPAIAANSRSHARSRTSRTLRASAESEKGSGR